MYIERNTSWNKGLLPVLGRQLLGFRDLREGHLLFDNALVMFGIIIPLRGDNAPPRVGFHIALADASHANTG